MRMKAAVEADSEKWQSGRDCGDRTACAEATQRSDLEENKAFLSISSFADNGGEVHLRTGLKLCTGKRQAGRETLTSGTYPYL
jgi:hypothetical protein